MGSGPLTARRRAVHGGFTLLELLVVILVMGLGVGLVSVIVQPDERALLDLEARRLASLVSLAALEARYSGSAIAWVVQPDSYAFEQQDAAGVWTPVSNNDSLRPRQLPTGMQVSALRTDAGLAADPQRLEFSPFGLSSAFDIELAYGTARTAVRMSPLGKVDVQSPVLELP